ncbi:phage portal protein [Enterococcus sp. DIV0755b]|uniref:phage portal protein n=1 Tax=Enterococcus sp. DIV0755b TaxID=2774657 RepID=UPI003F6864F8
MSFADIFKRNKELEWMWDLELVSETSQRVYLKKMAIDSVLNFVGRTMSTVQFKFTKDKKAIRSPWDYILNVRPNKDMSATLFWQKFIYKLMFDNEVLVVLSDDNQLLIADDFYREEYALYDDQFKNVIVKDYEFKRSFLMEDVIYLQYNNEQLEKFTDGLFNDYGELFGRMIEISMRNNQIRGSVSVETTGSFNDDEKDSRKQRLQNFIDKIYKSFRTSSVAIVPKMKGFEYEEYTNKMGVSNQSLDELDRMKKSLINDVARMIGVPPALIMAENAELDSNLDAYRKLCLAPLIRKLADELSAKLISKSEYEAGQRIEVLNVLSPNIFDLSEAIDKIVSSGAFYVDEVRNEAGYDDLPDDEGKQRLRTKNYEDVKGGESENDS